MNELTPTYRTDLIDSTEIEKELREVERIELRLRCNGLSQRCSELEAQLGQKQREVDDYKTALESLKGEVEGLRAELAALKTEGRELRARVSHLEQERGVINISDDEDAAHVKSGVDDSKKNEILAENWVEDEDLEITPAPERHQSEEKDDVPMAQEISDSEEEDVDSKKGEALKKDEDFVVTPAPKRKWALRLVDSDSEKEDGEEKLDDHIHQVIGDTEAEGVDSKKNEILEKDENYVLTPAPKRKRALRLVDSDSEKDDGEEKGYRQSDREISDAKGKGIDSKMGEFSGKNKDFLLTPAPKRKLATRIVSSDCEEDEDNVLIAKLKNKNKESDHFSGCCDKKNEDVVFVPDDDGDDEDVDDDDLPIGKLLERKVGSRKAYRDAINPSRKRLVKIGEGRPTRDGEGETSPRSSVSQNPSHSKTNSIGRMSKRSVIQKLVFSDNRHNEEKEADVDSDSEGDSLDGFIVDESESSSSGSSKDETKQGGSSDTSGEDSDSEVDLENVLSTLRRKKDTKKWEYEGDMLASFAEKPEICMKAVCALYRRQTSEEKSAKETIVVNNRGFNLIDAFRASEIAEFLLDGDINGPPSKSIKELEARYPKGVEYCRGIAVRYSKQLFSIYQQGEDPFFKP